MYILPTAEMSSFFWNRLGWRKFKSKLLQIKGLNEDSEPHQSVP